VDRGRISINSPIAQALIGEKKGSKIEVVAPAGLKAYQVKKVEWIANAH
jgi:transcription elongation factor GreA